ncbi:purine-nucleoside phosphorylase [Blastococcus sp. Marseille-P5729]|uniref:purine-nucleoside phosphorylase n=1 Tax=Blastococcus sp. Marseille-P5729 TaxID=2086582 RepID=UPI000D0F335D|nr:purine-nucleoside phosphorylase [Blastococcus sp. Marseille-P5729]
MSIHIGAEPGQIAPYVLMPGDPLRAKWIAENYLEDAKQYTDVRNMLGYTGIYKGMEISAQGSGMGLPSFSIYCTELFKDYDVQSVVRVGSAGAMQERVKIRDVILAQAACTDSNINRLRFEGVDFAPIADFELLQAAYAVGDERGMPMHVGNIISSDSFYNDRAELVSRTGEYGVLAVEMEAAALYTLAAKFQRKGLAIVTVSDHLLTGEETSSQERQESFGDMVEMALESIAAVHGI